MNNPTNHYTTAPGEAKGTRSSTGTVVSIDREWKKRLRLDTEGRILKIPANVLLILEHDELLKDRFTYDVTVGTAFKKKGLPWSERDDQYTTADKKQVSDADMKSLCNYIHNRYGIGAVTTIENAFAEYCMSIMENPLLDYLNGLQWDGVRRIDTLLIDYFNADDSPYTREVIRKTLTALVRRAYRPGFKFDECLVLQGQQGCGKSTFFSVLGGQWYTDAIDLSSDAAKTYESYRGKWLCELGELAGMRKAEAERVKLWFSCQTDRYRAPYGRTVQDIPRMCVAVGTTNDKNFLKDVTGNRRFWPVQVHKGGRKSVWVDLEPERDQILAEAKMIHESGEPLTLSQAAKDTALEMQKTFMCHDEWTDTILNFLEIPLPPQWRDLTDLQQRDFIEKAMRSDDEILNNPRRDQYKKRQRVTADIIWRECIGGSIERLTPQAGARIRNIMDQAEGWKRFPGVRKIDPYGKNGRGWERELPF